MRHVRFALIIVSVCFLNTAGAQTKIHKCTDAEGGIEYSQVPCAPQEPDAKAENAPPVPEKQDSPTSEIPQEEPKSEANRSACKKRYRDEIDAIDAEIGREYSPDKAERYKQLLLLLTRSLRQC